MEISKTDKVEAVVSRHLKAARVLRDHGIDFWAESARTIGEVCRESGVSFQKIVRQIQLASERPAVNVNHAAALPLDQLTRFIERHFHDATYGNMRFISHNLERLVRIYQGKYPELDALHQLFGELAANTTIHMRHEELILFPYIREMVKRGRRVRSSMLSSSESPIAEVIKDHQKSDYYVKKVHELTRHYTVPPSTGNTFKVTYASLAEFEADIMAHLRIEDEILFPRALEMEAAFNRATWSVEKKGGRKAGDKEK